MLGAGVGPLVKLRKRIPTQRVPSPNWPFLYSVDPARGLVKNVQTKDRLRVKVLRRRVKVNK